MLKTFFFLLALGLVSVAAQTPAPLNTAPTPLPNINDAERLGNEIFTDSSATGMVLVVVRGDQVYFHGYGETVPGSGRAPDAETELRLCSLTKIFTTDLLTRLAAAKTVSLDDPLSLYALPGARVPEREKAITLRDLATHTAGLSRELGAAPRGTPHFSWPDQAARWRWLSGQQLKSVPGQEALYSNVGFDLLGDALGRAAKKPMADLLLERTLTPLAMWQTTYYPSAAQCARLLAGPHDEGECSPTFHTAGSAGLYSTADDVTRWLKYLLGHGTPQLAAPDPVSMDIVLDPTTLKKQYGLDHAGKPSGVGLGWMHLGEVGKDGHIIEKTGGGAGFTTYIALLPERHSAIFFALADGMYGWKKNAFKEANNALLVINGLPPLPEEPFHPHRAARRAQHRAAGKAKPRSGTNRAGHRPPAKSARKPAHKPARKKKQ